MNGKSSGPGKNPFARGGGSGGSRSNLGSGLNSAADDYMQRVKKAQAADKKPDAPAKSPFAKDAKQDGSKTGRSSLATEFNPSRGDYAQRLAAAGVGGLPTERLTGENYQQAYLRKKAEEQAAMEKKAKEEAERRRKDNTAQEEKARQTQKMIEQRRADAFRARARDLQGQIAYWQQQLGQNPDNDARANAAIGALMNELNGIPGMYRG